jgi:hypothetical protein
MLFVNTWKERFKKNADMADFIFLKLAAMSFGVLLARWIPSLQNIDSIYIVIFFLLMAFKPVATVFRN